jgi:hypothetical protein
MVERRKETRAMRNFRFIIGMLGIVLVLFLLNVVFAGSSSEEYQTYPRGSTYSDSPDGAKLLYLLLNRLGFETRQVRNPFETSYLQTGTDIDLIWHVSTSTAAYMSNVQVSKPEINWLNDWVSGGGTMVLVSDPPSPDLTTVEFQAVTPADPLLDYWLGKFNMEVVQRGVTSLSDIQTPGGHRLLVNVKMPSGMGGPVGVIHTYEKRQLGGAVAYRFAKLELEETDVDVISDAYGVVLAKMKSGDGAVWLVADPYLFSNLLIQEAENAPLAITLAASARNGSRSRISFDEYHLGFVQSRTLADAARTPLGRAIMYIGALAALAVGTAGARFGRARAHGTAIGVSQRAFVEALAALWQGAHTSGAAAEALWRRYRSRSSAQRRGLDIQLENLKKSGATVEELMEVARKLDT